MKNRNYNLLEYLLVYHVMIVDTHKKLDQAMNHFQNDGKSWMCDTYTQSSIDVIINQDVEMSFFIQM